MDTKWLVGTIISVIGVGLAGLAVPRETWGWLFPPAPPADPDIHFVNITKGFFQITPDPAQNGFRLDFPTGQQGYFTLRARMVRADSINCANVSSTGEIQATANKSMAVSSGVINAVILPGSLSTTLTTSTVTNL